MHFAASASAKLAGVNSHVGLCEVPRVPWRERLGTEMQTRSAELFVMKPRFPFTYSVVYRDLTKKVEAGSRSCCSACRRGERSGR